MIAVTDDTGRVLGWAARVLDLANPEPEPEMSGTDPRAPLTLAVVLVQGSMRIGHTFDAADPDAPIWLEERPAPGWIRHPDLRCDECVTKTSAAYQDGQTYVIMQHARSCRWLRRMAKRHPRR